MEFTKTHTSRVRWRSVALPTEHGGWSFVLEPILLGLLLAPGIRGLAPGIAALAAFLLHHPLKLVIKDFRSGRSSPRTQLAIRFSVVYAALTAAAGVMTLLVIPSFDALLPLLCAMPLLVVQGKYDADNRSRSITAEISGAVAAGAVVSTMMLIHGWLILPSLGLWLALAARAITAILYVRARLRLERGRSAGVMTALIAHGIACILLLATAACGLLPWTTLAGMLILTGRAGLGLSGWRVERTPKQIGIQEVFYGLGFVMLTVTGYNLSE